MHASNPLPEPDVAPWRGCSDSPDQTEAWGVAVGRLAQAGDTIALIGELGAGCVEVGLPSAYKSDRACG